MGTDPISLTGGLVDAASNIAKGGIGSVFDNIVGKQPGTPAMPDYKSAAEATAVGNLKNAQSATAANRVNQHTQYGNLDYTQTGTDSSGNPMWTATQTLSPEQQKIYNQNTSLTQGMLGKANDAVGNLDMTGVDMSKLPSYGINPGQNYADAMMQQINPQLDRQQNSLNQNLANQGIPIGSEAYKNAQMDQASAANNARLQAVTGGMNVGLAANNQQFNQEAQNKQMPINMINALRGGNQVQDPNYVNPANQSTTPGPDYTGAANQTGQYNNNIYNQQTASRNSNIGGLMNIGTTAAMLMSDRRVKENITHIGNLPNGLNIYEFDYKPEFKDIAGHGAYIGVMADEVEKIIPEAVLIHPTGYKMVNYSMIG
jgi:hypothetical protein